MGHKILSSTNQEVMSNSQLQALRLTCYVAVAATILWLALELKTLIICLILALMLAAAMTPIAESCEKQKIHIPRPHDSSPSEPFSR